MRHHSIAPTTPTRRPPAASIVAVAIGLLALSAPQASARPPGFQQLTYEQATQRAPREGKMLVVDVMATWCGPCKAMDKNTWGASRVSRWVGENAIAIQVDADQRRDLMGPLGVNAYPTVLVFVNGEEVERARGYRDADAMMEILERANTLASALYGAGAGKPRVGPLGEVQLRLYEARKKVEDENVGDALEDYAWLWENMHKRAPKSRSLRMGQMLDELRGLCAEHDSFRARFKTLRDALSVRVDRPRASLVDLDDWASLNYAVGDDAATLRWFDAMAERRASKRTIDRVAERLFDPLVEQGRWEEAGGVFANPPKRAREIRMGAGAVSELAPDASEEDRAAQEAQWGALVARLSQLYAACLAADRAGAARAVARDAMLARDDAKMRRALVEAALKADAADGALLRLVEEAEGMGEDCADLREAIKKAAG